MRDFDFAQLRARYGTGRSYTIRGEGRYRECGYRSGIQCAAGDIEVHEWRRMVMALINQYGEQKLHQQLREFLKKHFWKMDREALEHYALELHACRIFDDPLWVSFIEFNKAYRPNVLESTRLVWILPECCMAPGQITHARLLQDQSGERTCCPHCGRWSHFQILNESDTLIERKESYEKTC